MTRSLQNLNRFVVEKTTYTEQMDLFRDRDYIQDVHGDLFQVLGSLHFGGEIFALHKYHPIPPEFVENPNEQLLLYHSIRDCYENDPVIYSQHPIPHIWKQKSTNTLYLRVLPNYSSLLVDINSRSHPYTRISSIFNHPLIHVPRNQIQNHWIPTIRFHELIALIDRGSFSAKSQLDILERESIESALEIADFFSLPRMDFGISGSILWSGQHDLSDIDLIVYGWDNTKAIYHSTRSIPPDRRGIHGITLSEQWGIAGKIALKTGLTSENCFQLLMHKPTLLKFNQRRISLTCVPTYAEINRSPLYRQNSTFHSLGSCIVRARILDDTWGYYYPSLFLISCESILNFPPNLNISAVDLLQQITRLCVYEHDLMGYYQTGDLVEIRGLLQFCQVPQFNSLNLHDTYQILVGGMETYNQEYINTIDIQ